MKNVFAALTASAIFAFAANTQAVPVYSTVGTENPTTYSFTAAATGDIVAYFTGSTASYVNELGLLVNGVSTGIFGLNNHSSAYGDQLQLNLGSVNAGDVLVFQLNSRLPSGSVIGPWYSTQSMNSDGINHVYSAAYGGDALVPAGTFVAFEDMAYGGDLNYNDETFVFTNVVASSKVPEPASLALLGLGLVSLVASRRRKTG